MDELTLTQAQADAMVTAAVQAERKRCRAWAYAMRSGDLDDARSVIYGIDGGEAFEREPE